MISSSAIHPDEVHISLKNQSNTRMQASLDTLHEVCRNQKTSGSVDFSLPTIAALLKKHQGPSYQTLRNKNPQGERYRTLIDAWSRFSGGNMKKLVKSVAPSSEGSILQKIPDAAVRGLVGGIIAENSRLRGEVQVLRQRAEYVIDRRPVLRTQQDSDAVDVAPALCHLTGIEVEALRHAVSDKFLMDEGWVLDDSGRIKTAKGRPIFKPGFATAIRKILHQK
jgi:hypothetical protein